MVFYSVVWISVRVLRLLLLRISSPDNSAKKKDMKHETRGSVDSRLNQQDQPGADVVAGDSTWSG
jgi:hypothetical protein